MRRIIYIGLCLAFALTGFKLIELVYVYHYINLELYISIIALLFLLMGFTMARFLKIPRQPLTTDGLGLTHKEEQTLNLIAEGLSNKQISEFLGVSINTVKTHTQHIFQKLGVGSRTQAIAKLNAMKR